MPIRLRHIFLYLLLSLPIVLSAQLNIILEQIPENTPNQDSIFLAINFNNWKPGDPNFRFKRNQEGLPEITLSNPPKNLEFKITRGDWKKVESNQGGWAISNRTFTYTQPTTLRLRVKGWEDLMRQVSMDSLYLIVEAVPNSTPKDASLYVVGNFNEWNPSHPRCEMKRTPDNTFTIAMPIWQDTILYKYTRGSWETVEGKKSGRARSNRIYIAQENGPHIIRDEIKSWEDLNAQPVNLYSLILLLAAFLGLLLILAINTLQQNNTAANRTLSWLIFVLSVALLTRVSTYDRDFFNRFSKLHIVSDYLYFLYAPLFLQYIQKLLRPERKRTFISWLHFLPFLIHVALYMPFWTMSAYDFRLGIVNNSFLPIFHTTGGIALIYNIAYWFWCLKIISKYREDAQHFQAHTPNIQFLNTVMTLKAIGISLWLATYLVGAYAKYEQIPLNQITDFTADSAWAIFSLTVYTLGYFAMRQPEIFKLPEASQPEDEPEKIVTETEQKNWQEWMDKVEHLMQSEQPFLNPKLTLPDLAEKLHTNVHTLSKVINEGFGKNFNDFVNSYRVEEFKRRVLIEPYKNQTFLAIALSVGFNSKTAFNRSFKKLTEITPREYIKQQSPQEDIS